MKDDHRSAEWFEGSRLHAYSIFAGKHPVLPSLGVDPRKLFSLNHERLKPVLLARTPLWYELANHVKYGDDSCADGGASFTQARF